MLKKTIVSLLAFPLMFFISCKNDDIDGTPNSPVEVRLSVKVQDEVPDNGRVSSEVLSEILVTIEDDLGNEVVKDSTITLLSAGGTYLSSPLTFVPGTYFITQFIVLNDEGSAIYAAPLAGSFLADFVDDPLPVAFLVTANTSVTHEVEVLPITEGNVGDFGYAVFSLNPTIVFEVSAFLLDGVTGLLLTDAIMVTTSNGDTLSTDTLQAGVNTVRVSSPKNEYLIHVMKDGESLMETLTYSDLLVHTVGSANPLKFIFGAGRTGSENGGNNGNGNGNGVPKTPIISSSGTFVYHSSFLAPSEKIVALADFNGDGFDDLFVQNAVNLEYWEYSPGSGFAHTKTLLSTMIHNIDAHGIAADFDADGDPDVAIAGGRKELYVFLNDLSGDPTETVDAVNSFEESTNRDLIAAGDIDGDGDLDIVNMLSTSTLLRFRAFINDGTGRFFGADVKEQPGAVVEVGDIALADVDADGNADLIGVKDEIYVWVSDGVGYRDNFTTKRGSREPGVSDFNSMEVGDFDYDGDVDVLAFFNINGASYIRNNSSANFTVQAAENPLIAVNGTLTGIRNSVLGDVNGDGDLDLVLLGRDPNEMVVVHMAPTGASVAQRFQLNENPGPILGRALFLADWNNDGRLDLFTGGRSEAAELWLGQP